MKPDDSPLLDARSTLQQIADNAMLAVYAKDFDGRLLFVNREFERIAGRPVDAIVGRLDTEIFPAATAEGFRRNDRRVLEELRALEFEEPVEVGGEKRVYLSQKFPLLRPDGRAYAVCGVSTDITERKRAEEALRAAATAVSAEGGESVFGTLTRAIAAILDVDVAFIAIFDDDAPGRMRTLAAMLDGGMLRNFEYELEGSPCAKVVGRAFRMVESGVRCEFPPGTLFEVKGMDSYAAFPLNDSAGRPLGLIATMDRAPMRDALLAESLLRIFAARAIAEVERARGEAALRRSEASYRAVFEATEDAMFIHDWDTGAILDVNPKACAVYGYTPGEFRALGLEAVGAGEPPYTAAHAAHHIARAKRGEVVVFEWHRRNRDGTLHWDEVYLKAVEIAGRPRVLACTREITARKAAEQALRESGEQYRAIFNSAVDGLALWSAGGRIVDANASFLAMFGRSRGEVVGGDGDVVPDAMRDYCRTRLASVLAGEPCRTELRVARRDGTLFDVEVRGVAMQYRDRPHVLAIVRDLTPQREAERARAELEDRLRQAQKMEAIGRMAGGIAHDFNNLLTTILGYVTLAAEASPDARLRRYLDEARSASGRARDLIAQMLAFSRGRRGRPRPVALDAVAGEVIRLLRSSLPSSVTISTDVAPETPAAVVDPVQLEQVVLNLGLNARDAMGSRGEIRVRIGRARLGAETCSSCGGPASGEWVELSVEDTGPGVPPGVRDRIFEPFFTTKEAGQGTGMGLATVHGIVHEHGGHVLLESGPEGGARFRVLFPAAQQASDAVDAERVEAAGFPRGTLAGRVVLVDDEPAVAGYMAELLTQWGLAVRTFLDPRAALEALRDDPSFADLVLTDYTMPGMSGLELARACRALPVRAPVVLYTGYAESTPRGARDAAGVAALVRKPVDPGALFETLRSLLARGA